jgi:putative PIG3 family NAD(P)H quinone oxidoreductase
MRAITVHKSGDSNALRWTAVPNPRPTQGQVIVRVAATAVNRADLLQRAGSYPPPPGASHILGLECSGTIVELGPGVRDWKVGDEVCALLAGGGYAELVAVPVGQLLRIPAGLDHYAAASLPEVACTVWSNLVVGAGMRRGQVLLVHGGAGGIGSHAIQVATAMQVRVAATAGSDEKLALCRELGAQCAINYKEQDFVAEIKSFTGGFSHQGADVILDNMGAKYLSRNLDALAPDGRVVVIGLQGGRVGELDFAKLMAKRGAIMGTTLRARPETGRSSKAEVVREVAEHVWPMVEAGQVKPIVYTELPITEAEQAHELMESGQVMGKVVLRVA